jgi:hypothetical protein
MTASVRTPIIKATWTGTSCDHEADTEVQNGGLHLHAKADRARLPDGA